MVKFNEENERVKRRYLTFLREAKGQDVKSLDKVAAALRQFEDSTGAKPFKQFHIEQATRFKAYLDKQRNSRTGKPLSLSTIDATLRQVKAFFIWLAGQPGYKSRISYADAEYFNNTARKARAAHAKRPIPYPSMQQCLRAFEAMSSASSSMEMPALMRRTLDWLSTSLSKGMSRDGHRVTFWADFAIKSSPRRAPEATLPISLPVTPFTAHLYLSICPPRWTLRSSCARTRKPLQQQ